MDHKRRKLQCQEITVEGRIAGYVIKSRSREWFAWSMDTPLSLQWAGRHEDYDKAVSAVIDSRSKSAS